MTCPQCGRPQAGEHLAEPGQCGWAGDLRCIANASGLTMGDAWERVNAEGDVVLRAEQMAYHALSKPKNRRKGHDFGTLEERIVMLRAEWAEVEAELGGDPERLYDELCDLVACAAMAGEELQRGGR